MAWQIKRKASWTFFLAETIAGHEKWLWLKEFYKEKNEVIYIFNTGAGNQNKFNQCQDRQITKQQMQDMWESWWESWPHTTNQWMSQVEPHDWIGKKIHWEVCCKFRLNMKEKWYVYQLETVIVNECHKTSWDFSVQTNHVIDALRPDFIVIDKVAIVKLLTLLFHDTKMKSGLQRNLKYWKMPGTD